VVGSEFISAVARSLLIVPLTTTERGWVTDIPVDGWGWAQGHLVQAVSKTRLAASHGVNVGPATLAQIRESIAVAVDLP
jgi:mRNA-degrading endonuclease toxin of MazEF toxin-antitoxin module